MLVRQTSKQPRHDVIVVLQTRLRCRNVGQNGGIGVGDDELFGGAAGGRSDDAFIRKHLQVTVRCRRHDEYTAQVDVAAQGIDIDRGRCDVQRDGYALVLVLTQSAAQKRRTQCLHQSTRFVGEREIAADGHQGGARIAAIGREEGCAQPFRRTGLQQRRVHDAGYLQVTAGNRRYGCIAESEQRRRVGHTVDRRRDADIHTGAQAGIAEAHVVAAAEDRSAGSDIESAAAADMHVAVGKCLAACLHADTRYRRRKIHDIAARSDRHVTAGQRADSLLKARKIDGPRDGRAAQTGLWENRGRSARAPEPRIHELIGNRALDVLALHRC